MNLVLHIPNVQQLARLRDHFFEHAFSLAGDAGRWSAASVVPGDLLPMLRIVKGRASFDITRWDAAEPVKIVTSPVSFADRCLIPTISTSSPDAVGAELQMLAGCWLRLNPSEPASLRLLARTDPSGLDHGLIVVHESGWKDWIEPGRDVRDLLRA